MSRKLDRARRLLSRGRAKALGLEDIPTEAEEAYRSTSRGRGEGSKRKARPTKWTHGEFVALDGEGFSGGRSRRIKAMTGTVYEGRRHVYSYLAASDGRQVYNRNKRITLSQALEFISEISAQNAFAIIVTFGGSYDIAHICGHSLKRDQLMSLLGRDGSRYLAVDCDEYSYRIMYRPRKYFRLQRWPRGVAQEKLSSDGTWVLTDHVSATVWDVWGFFQSSFVEALEQWTSDCPDLEMIRAMKARREDFSRRQLAEIKAYNRAELWALVGLMDALRASIDALGLKITRWDGMGSIAAAMMREHGVKAHMRQELPSKVFEAVRRSYSGGRIETVKIGYHHGPIYHYDLVSAYPSGARWLPSLSMGQWRRYKGLSRISDQDHAIVHLDFAFDEGAPFYPLFFRCHDGSIIYPRRGSGWYWSSEYKLAKMFADHFGGNIHIREVLAFKEKGGKAPGGRPFAWIEGYHAQRIALDAQGGGGERGDGTGPHRLDAGIGPALVIKRALAAIYGKLSQQVGAQLNWRGELRLPPYFQLDWAARITADARAALLAAAMQKPQAIVSFNTDAIYSLEPLDLPLGLNLGQWSLKVHSGMTSVMPGVYWLHGDHAEGVTRGYTSADLGGAEFVHEAWKQGMSAATVTITRLIGIPSACQGRDFWRMRGDFMRSRVALALDGDNSKRYPVPVHSSRLWERMVTTEPRDHFLTPAHVIPESAPYPIQWLDADRLAQDDDPEGAWMIEREIEDGELA